MGMFDTIIIKGLKLKQPREVSSFLSGAKADFPSKFQTKDLDNTLSTYYIDENGMMTHTVYKPTGRLVKNKNKLPNFFCFNNSSFLEKIYNKYRFKRLDKKYPSPRLITETKPVVERCNSNSTFNVYSYDEIDGRFLSLDYKITTTNGQVTKAILTQWHIESEREAYRRKKRDQEWKQQTDQHYQQQQIFQSKWYYPILKEIYNPVVFFGKKILQYVGNNLIKLTYRWQKI